MKLLVIFCCVVVIVSPVKTQNESILDTILRAEVAYSTGDYQTAVTLYESLNSANNPAVHFNLGNTYYQLGDIGHALLNYRRAQQFWPRDVDLTQNLRRVFLNRVDIQMQETGFWEALAASTANIVTLDELTFVVGTLWTGWFGLLGAQVLRFELRSRLQIVFILVGLCLACGLVLLGSRIFVSMYRSPAVVVTAETQVMSGSGGEYLELFSLHAGAEIYVWSEKNQWVQFSLPDGRLGWLPKSDIEFVTVNNRVSG